VLADDLAVFGLNGPDNGLLLGDGLVVILGGGFGPAVRLFLDEHRGLVDPKR